MNIQLRGHHLLCLLGYRGMGYSAAYVQNMSAVYQQLLVDTATSCTLVEGPDQLCACYPQDGDYHCESRTVMERDALILSRLDLQVGQTLPWQEILSRVAVSIQAADLTQICATCPWLPYGVCQEGVQLIADGKPLPALRQPK